MRLDACNKDEEAVRVSKGRRSAAINALSAKHEGLQAIMEQCDVIVEVGAEGGSIALIGTRRDRGWTFSCSVNDCTPELIDEEPIFHKSAEVDSWEAALRLLDKYPWQTLYPSKVHPEFRARVWIALQERLTGDEMKSSELERWRSLCT